MGAGEEITLWLTTDALLKDDRWLRGMKTNLAKRYEFDQECLRHCCYLSLQKLSMVTVRVLIGCHIIVLSDFVHDLAVWLCRIYVRVVR